MDWPSIVGASAAAAGVAAAVVWGLVYRKGSQVWASKKAVENMVTLDQLNGLGTRVSELAQEHVGIAKLADDNHDRIALLDQEVRHRGEMMASSVVQPLEAIASRLEEMQKSQTRMLETQATHTTNQRAFGKSLDDLRDRFNRMEDR